MADFGLQLLTAVFWVEEQAKHEISKSTRQMEFL
jgi:hypothetical protein